MVEPEQVHSLSTLIIDELSAEVLIGAVLETIFLPKDGGEHAAGGAGCRFSDFH